MKQLPPQEFATSTIGIKEAARFLGYRSTSRLSQKAKRGLIPGAFKAAKQWMFIKEKLVEYVEDLENRQRKNAQVNTGVKVCQSQKRKIVPIGTQDFRLMELECKNLRKRLLEERPKNMKRDEEKILENRFYSGKSRVEPGSNQK